MHQYNQTKSSTLVKDSTKGQKIAAALYLVTEHLSDTDPVRLELRTAALSLLPLVARDTHNSIVEKITELISVAVLARLISEKNASIILLELRHYKVHLNAAGDAVTEALNDQFSAVSETMPGTASLSFSLPKKTSQTHLQNGQKKSLTFASTSTPFVIQEGGKNGAKGERQEQILSFINARKSAGIKDIAALFEGVSEKTIQRELGTLVAGGRITKRGEKRWSVYMAVTA